MRHVRNLDIVGHDVGVYLVNDAEMRVADGTKEGDLTPEGLTLYAASMICILETAAPDRLKDTLLHEIGHYFIDATGLREFIDATVKKAARATWEEQFIRFCAPWIILFAESNINPLSLETVPVSGAV